MKASRYLRSGLSHFALSTASSCATLISSTSLHTGRQAELAELWRVSRVECMAVETPDYLWNVIAMASRRPESLCASPRNPTVVNYKDFPLVILASHRILRGQGMPSGRRETFQDGRVRSYKNFLS